MLGHFDKFFMTINFEFARQRNKFLIKNQSTCTSVDCKRIVKIGTSGISAFSQFEYDYYCNTFKVEVFLSK